MEEKKGFLARQKEEWRSLIFRAPSRRRWGRVGFVASFVMIYYGLAAGNEDLGWDVSFLPPFGVIEGLGTLFGSLAELMPKEQTTLIGVLRLWAGIFVGCGFALMAIGVVLGGGPPVP